MSAQTAQIVFFAIAAIMWIVWLAGTRFARSRVRPSRPEPGGAGAGADTPADPEVPEQEGPNEEQEGVDGEQELQSG